MGGGGVKGHLSLEGVNQPETTFHLRVPRKSANLTYFIVDFQN